jgi:hypothetical protein
VSVGSRADGDGENKLALRSERVPNTYPPLKEL